MAILSIRNLFNRNQPVSRKRITQTLNTQEIEVAFIASLADLSVEEREARIQRRAWYKALAERQGIAEVEWQTERAQQNDSYTLNNWR